MLKVVSILIMAFSFSACAQTTYTSQAKISQDLIPLSEESNFTKQMHSTLWHQIVLLDGQMNSLSKNRDSC